MGARCSGRNSGENRWRGAEERYGGRVAIIPAAEVRPRTINWIGIARQRVLAAWVELIEGQITKAKEGGYQQFKLLVDLCGLRLPDGPEVTMNQRETLCDALLEGLTLLPPVHEEAGDEQESDRSGRTEFDGTVAGIVDSRPLD